MLPANKAIGELRISAFRSRSSPPSKIQGQYLPNLGPTHGMHRAGARGAWAQAAPLQTSSHPGKTKATEATGKNLGQPQGEEKHPTSEESCEKVPKNTLHLDPQHAEAPFSMSCGAFGVAQLPKARNNLRTKQGLREKFSTPARGSLVILFSTRLMSPHFARFAHAPPLKTSSAKPAEISKREGQPCKDAKALQDGQGHMVRQRQRVLPCENSDELGIPRWEKPGQRPLQNWKWHEVATSQANYLTL